ncbi:replicative DNA helicase [Streptosporangium sp. NPDC050855]|uniref:replicative DNA helicase n=1 Tax=Streptosporangium sp. NPDC050855 TaxID=3366194 RepID=UPI00378D3D63
MTAEIDLSSFDGWAPSDAVIAAEVAVAGAVIQSKEAMGEAADLLAVDDFFSAAGAVFAAALSLLHAGKPIDPASVFGELHARGDTDRVGGGPYLATLMEHAAAAGSLSYHARRVANDGLRRRINTALRRSLQMTENAGWDPEADVDMIRKLVDDAAAHRLGDQPQDVSQDMIDLLNDLENPPPKAEGIVPPYVDLASLVTSFQAGQLIVVGARPSVGKSTFAVDVVRSAALRDNQRVVMFTLEMSRREVLQRISSAEAKVSLKAIRDYDVTGEQLARLSQTAARVSGAPLSIDDQPGCSLERIRSVLRTLLRTGPIGMVVVDYLQLLTAPKAASREQEIAALTRGMKLLAMEFRVPIMLLSQLSRESEKRADKRPVASDLRESGAIEQDSDIVILLHRDDYYEPTCARAGEADLIVAKNRNGPRATITVASQLHYSRFVDMAPNTPGQNPPAPGGHLRAV